jgi:hypothetical protein
LQRKYIVLIIGILGFVVLASGCISIGGFFQDLSDNNYSMNTYSANGISFNYPDNWSTDTDNEDQNTIKITASPNYSSDNFTSIGPFPVHTVTITSHDDAQFQVQITHNDNMSEQEVSQIVNAELDQNMKKISSGTLTVDGKKAYEEMFTTNFGDDIGTIRYDQIGFVKNGNTYLMVFQVKNEDFAKEKQNFDIILNSFKVQ